MNDIINHKFYLHFKSSETFIPQVNQFTPAGKLKHVTLAVQNHQARKVYL